MAQARKIQTAAPVAYRYSPGDGYTYTWDGTSATATVYRHSYPYTDQARLVLVDTRDRVPMEGVARTATAFSIAVLDWRVGRVTGAVPQP